MEGIEWIKGLQDEEVYAIKFPENMDIHIISGFLKKYKEETIELNKNIRFIGLPFGIDIVRLKGE